MTTDPSDSEIRRSEPSPIPSTLASPGALRFWAAVVFTGALTGAAAGLLTKMLQWVQRIAWGGDGRNLLASATAAPAGRHMFCLLLAGITIALGQLVLKKVSNANGIDVTAAIWFYGGKLPYVRTLGSALLSIVAVGLGISLGREGAPKQFGAVIANLSSDRGKLSIEQRQLLVACGAGAGMAAAYGVPLGGALFAMEVLRGILALRFVLPAICCSAVATGVSWMILPDSPTYPIPAYTATGSVVIFAILAGPIAGLCSVVYVRAITLAERHRPDGWSRFFVPVGVMAAIGVVSIWYPEVLGNGKDFSELSFLGKVAPSLLFAMFILKPVATWMCVGSGAPGGLFTPSLTFGAALGGLLGVLWSFVVPGAPLGLFALLGAGAVLAATTQGPLSTVVLMMELTGRDRSFVLPLLVSVVSATLVARRLEPRSIYDAKLPDDQIDKRMKQRDRSLGISSGLPESEPRPVQS